MSSLDKRSYDINARLRRFNKNSQTTRSTNVYRGNIEEWLRDAKIAKVFSEVANSLKEGKQIELKEIGIKRTPYTKLMDKENELKARIKRKDFIDLLKREQKIVKSRK